MSVLSSISADHDWLYTSVDDHHSSSTKYPTNSVHITNNNTQRPHHPIHVRLRRHTSTQSTSIFRRGTSSTYEASSLLSRPRHDVHIQRHGRRSDATRETTPVSQEIIGDNDVCTSRTAAVVVNSATSATSLTTLKSATLRSSYRRSTSPSLRLFRWMKRCSIALTVLSVIGSVLAQEEVSQVCDELYEASETLRKGVFETPGYPNPYPANLNCRYRFRAGPGQVVWVEWDKFHLREPLARNNQCLYDYVEIIVTDQQDQQHVSGRYCGDKTPPNLETMQPTVDIRFHSENSLSYSGFRATYSFLDEKQVPAPKSVYPATMPDELKLGCGGVADGKYSGTIVSPGYPLTYPSNVECNWLIRVQRGKQIYVKLQDLQLSETMQCNDAALFIIDGYKHSTVLAQAKDLMKAASSVRFCGNIDYHRTDGARGYMSDQNRMLIRFVSRREPHVSDYKDDRVGFRLTWTEVSVAEDENQCDQFLCSGGEYCIDEVGSVCTKGKQYCIHKSLVCDGAPNCAEHDDSDEENCYAIQIVTAGVLMVAFLVFIIVTVICCQRRRNQQQLYRMKQRHVQSHSQHNHQDSTMTHLSVAAAGNSAQPPAAESGHHHQHDPRLLNMHSSPNNVPPNARQSVDLRAMPANYHGYNLPNNQTSAQSPHNVRQRRQAGNESDDDEHRPFLGNHVSHGTSTGNQPTGYTRKPLRVPVPPDIDEPPVGFIQAHAEPVHVWEVKQPGPGTHSHPRRAASAQPPNVTVRQSHQFRQLGSNRQSSADTEFSSMCTPPLVEVHQSQRHVPVEDVLFDDQLRLTTASATPGRQPTTRAGSTEPTMMARYSGHPTGGIPHQGGTDNRLMLHGSSDHLTAFARPALSTSASSATPMNSQTSGAMTHGTGARDSPVVQPHTHRKKVGFADSVDEQPASSTGTPPPKYDESSGDQTTQRGVSPWRHHKSAIV